MHDPNTLAFEIKWPFGGKPLGIGDKVYRESVIDIWHVDPWRGSEDSCGWFRPRLTKEQREKLKALAFHEAREPWFRALPDKTLSDPVEAETLVRAGIVLVAQVLGQRFSLAQAQLLAMRLVHTPGDNIRSFLAFLPGWHSNFAESRESDREESAVELFTILARNVLGELRPWWRHPRWHIWHWRIRVIPLQKFKRWAFTRCQSCGNGFRWGEAPVSHQWYGDGPRWFRSESVYHMRCSRAQPTETSAA